MGWCEPKVWQEAVNCFLLVITAAIGFCTGLLYAEYATEKQRRKHMQVLRPLGSNIVIKRNDAEEVTKGGIIIPEKAKDKPGQGTVIAVGTGRTLENGCILEPAVKVGDSVLFNKWASEYEINGEKFAILKEEEILAVIESDEKIMGAGPDASRTVSNGTA